MIQEKLNRAARRAGGRIPEDRLTRALWWIIFALLLAGVAWVLHTGGNLPRSYWTSVLALQIAHMFAKRRARREARS